MENTDSFTDDQMLNLVNETIRTKTSYSPEEFTGGYVSATISRNKKNTTFKVALLFGYKNRNSLSEIFEIERDLVYIWIKAIMLKLRSIQLDSTGMNFNELNALMNKSYDDRTTTRTHPYLTSTSYQDTSTSLPLEDEHRTTYEFMRLKEKVLKAVREHYQNYGYQMIFDLEGQEVSFSDNGIAYYRKSGKNLSFSEQDRLIQQVANELCDKGGAA